MNALSMPTAPAPATTQLPHTPLQLFIKETLGIPDHLTSTFNKGDMRMAYTRYLAVQDARRRLSQLRADGTWTQKLPSLEEASGVFFRKTTYFNHSWIFAKVSDFHSVEQWLLGEEDAPSDSKLWGSKRPTYAKLEELVGLQEEQPKSKKKKGKKGDNSKKGSSSKSNRM